MRTKTSLLFSHACAGTAFLNMTEIRGLDLPDIEIVAAELGSECYGANHVAAAHCGLKVTPHHLRGHWKHGWHPEYWQFHPHVLVSDGDRKDYYWVARADEERYLRRHGYRHVAAIGLPMVYVKPRSTTRRPGSLLVMPAHSLEYTTHTWKFDQYADEIDSIKHNFTEVVVCVHQSCWKHGYWVDAFKARGYALLKGASIQDRNSLDRIYRILSSFEYMTTNSFGSNIAYAALLGAKVSIYGTYAALREQDLSNDQFYSENPHLLGSVITAGSEQIVRHHFSELFCHPREAVERVEWGRHQVGYDRKVTPREMRRLFGWSAGQRPLCELASLAHTARTRLPGTVKHWGKLVLRPDHRSRHRELRRLTQLPAGRGASTRIFGEPFHLLDPVGFPATYREFFEEQIYRFYTTDETPLIIVGGANVGVGVVYYKMLYPHSKIVAFEPDPDVFKALQANCQSLGICGVDLAGKALWTSDATVEFRREWGPRGRIVPGGAPGEGIPVPTCRLRGYLGSHIDLLALDIGGMETEVLGDCADLLSNVGRIIVTYHSHVDRLQTLGTLMEILSRAGFRLHVHSVNPSQQPFVHRSVSMGFDMRLRIFGTR